MSNRFELARVMAAGLPALATTEAQGDRRQPASAPRFVEGLPQHFIASMLGPETRSALQQAATPREWSALLISSPEFMYR
jgi:hypothetical protein